ncbi:MAG: 4-hydroxy-tetrahydrodipicolinate synthase [Fimbriimonas ginsengisoli]|uniref:4-hydroxy-tetrahydrodipicolinate synthase n=1 Tax=Fimbriimonas ginsengisoli TaxID=1005039 RepID=A0A931LRK8_FIMGI|nr:4-hydroxy-tetrahydrodipicolinate synthase [Fimbriimonas ginsengisoli]MBI3721232.1 4-hydroxy-tetrahydrodipicolinate synthase [Fimbriimonas ginsengisoli]
MGAFQAKRDWGRLLTAMVTPFDSEGRVNYAEAARLARHLVEKERNDGLVISGTTGESPTLEAAEKFRLLETVLEAVGDRAAVLFGAGTYNTAESVHLAKEAERLGAHGVMVVNPYYNKPGQAGLYAHFEAVAGATSLPVLLYNIQGRTSINLETPTLLRLAQIENIVGVKEASGNLAQISDVCREAPEGFRVYSGDDALTLPILALGGHGLVSVAAHVAGSEIAELIGCSAERPGRARQIHHRLTPLFKALFAFPSPVPVKYALSLAGFDTQRVRLPLVELAVAEKAVVRDALKCVERVNA